MRMTETITTSSSDPIPSPESAMKKLEILVGGALKQTVMVNGEPIEVTIRQIKTGKIPLLITAAGSMLGALTSKEFKLDIPNLLLFHSYECLNLLSVLLEQPRSVVDEFELDDTISLLTKCVEVNLDFFVQKVLPLLSGGLKNLGETVKSQQGKIVNIGKTLPNA